MTAGQLIVLRHGRTAWNASGRWQGQTDIGLDQLGVAQAERAAAVLAELAPSAIYASDLARAMQTAEPLARACGLPVVPDRRLREINVGSWSGLTIAEGLAQMGPEDAARWRAGEDVRRSATGETVAEVADRAAEALTEIGLAAPSGSTVIAVMHGLAGVVGVCRMVGLPPEYWRLFGALQNGGWIIVEWHQPGGFWRIAEYNVAPPR